MRSESKFTKETWDNWLEPFQTVRLLVAAGLDDREQAVNWLKGNLRRGELRGGGLHLTRLPDELVKCEWVYGRYKAETWTHVAAIPWKDDFWVSGNYEPDDPLDIYLRSTKPDEFEYHLYDVRFEPQIIMDFCRRATGVSEITPTMPLAAVPARRGPKRKDWWDHLWIDMIRQLQAGTLNPTSVADLQRILEDHASHSLNVDVGDSTLKPMASNLFKFLKKNVGEIGEN